MLSSEIKNWKGEDIVIFQEELRSKVNAAISEKSFYTYFKNTSEKLPRLDILNLLSQYVGYSNWADFQKQHPAKRKKQHSYRYFILIATVILLAFVAFNYIKLENEKQFKFCFIDADRGQPILVLLRSFVFVPFTPFPPPRDQRESRFPLPA